MARVATSRGTRLPYLGYHSSRKYQRSASGISRPGRLVARLLRDPDAAALAARRFRHEAQLVFAGNAGGMYLDEFAVGVVDALLEDRRLRRTGADDGVCALAEDGAVAAGGEDNGFAGEGADFHGAQVHGDDAAAHAFRIDDGGEELPALVLADLAFGFVAANLLVERVEELLAGGCAGKCGAVVKRAAKTAEIQQSFRGAVEGHAHAIKQVDDGRGRFAHRLHRRLVGEEIAAVNGVVKVLPGSVAFAFQVFGGVDAALCTNAVRTLDRDDGKQVHRCRRPRQF